MAAASLSFAAVSRTPRLRGRFLYGAALLALLLVLIPLLGGDFLAYQVGLFLLYGVATQGVALCWGRLGFLPLGHSLFFGLGAYLSGGTLKAAQTQTAWYFALPLAALLPALIGWGLARLVFARSFRSGPFFSLITLALAMLGFLSATRLNGLTGGFNGMTNIPELPGLDRFGTMYWLVAGFALLVTTALGIVLRRPIGTLWHAIALNEDRLQFFGFATDRMKANAYGFSALCASTAGLLFAPHEGIVTPESMGFLLSTEFVIWAAVGGKGSPLGALLGAVAVGYASAELRDHFAYWEVIVAIGFMAVVRFLPDGLVGLGSRLPGRPPQVPQHATQPPIAVAPIARVPAELVLEGIRSTAGGVSILKGLSLQLRGAGVRCLIGPNGAGKTSAFNAITGRLSAQDGAMSFAQRSLRAWPAWRVARLGIGRKFQIPTVFDELTVRDNLAIATWAGRLRWRDALSQRPRRWEAPLLHELLALFPQLAAQMHQPAGVLAQGDRQALELVMTALPEPRLLLLDEPCAGLSLSETQRMMNAILLVAHRLDAAALVIEHDMSAVERIAEHVYVMHQGALLAQGSLAQMQASAEVRAVYAGGQK